MKKIQPIINYLDSWQLTKESFQFLSQHRDLNILPFLGLLATLAFIICIGELFPNKAAFHDVARFSVLVVLYCMLSFILVFLNTALIAITLKRLNREEARILDGIYIAVERLPSLSIWSLMAIPVTFITTTMEGPQYLCKKLFGYSPGFCWRSATYFVLPIFICNDVTPIKAMYSSTKAVGHGWKNTVSAKALITVFFVFVLLIVSEFITNPDEIYHLMLFVAPTFLIAYFVGSTLEAIIVSALYTTVVQKKDPKYFDTSILSRAFVKEE